MRISRAHFLSAARWLFLVACLYLLAVYLLMFIFMGDYTIDAFFRPMCPDGWWHTSPFWAHCAFPPVSIAKYAIVYTAAFTVALSLTFLLAPRFKKKSCYALMSICILAPIVWQLVFGVSWTACASLLGVAIVGYLFFVWRLRVA
jgi:hypothetical protein